MMSLTGRLTPDFKTIADFCKDNGPATGVGRGISLASFLKRQYELVFWLRSARAGAIGKA